LTQGCLRGMEEGTGPRGSVPFLMENTMRLIHGFALALAALTSFALPSIASAQVLQAGVNYIPNETFDGVANLSNTSYTNATTTPTILTGATLTIPATVFDYTKELYTACWTADVTKSTATTGSVGVAIGGTVIAASYRYSASSAGRNAIGGCYSWVRTAATAQVIALYAVSADTNSFAVQNAQIKVQRTIFN
jgi:hypothetical protein